LNNLLLEPCTKREDCEWRRCCIRKHRTVRLLHSAVP